MAFTSIDTTIQQSVISSATTTAVPPAPAGATGLGAIPMDQYQNAAQSTFSFGNGTNRAEGHFHGTWNVGAAAQVVFDMTGTLLDVNGGTIAATEVKAIFIKNNNLVAGDSLNLFGDVAAVAQPVAVTLAVGDAVTLGPGGAITITNPIDGYAVAGGANDRIEVSNAGGNTVSFDIFVLYEE